MSEAYIKSVRERLQHARIVFDRFHVQRLVSDAFDAVRRSLMATLDPSGGALKTTRFALLKNPWDLTRLQRKKLADVQRHNAPLYRAGCHNVIHREVRESSSLSHSVPPKPAASGLRLRSAGGRRSRW